MHCTYIPIVKGTSVCFSFIDETTRADICTVLPPGEVAVQHAEPWFVDSPAGGAVGTV